MYLCSLCLITDDLYNLRVEKHWSFSLHFLPFLLLHLLLLLLLVLLFLLLGLGLGLCCCVVHMLPCYMRHKRLGRQAQTHATKYPYSEILAPCVPWGWCVFFCGAVFSAAQRRSAISAAEHRQSVSRNPSSSATEGGNSSRRTPYSVTRFYSSRGRVKEVRAWRLARHSWRSLGDRCGCFSTSTYIIEYNFKQSRVTSLFKVN